MPLPDLDLLVAIVQTGSLSGAAERLAMPRATVSRRLQRLEEEFGAVLIQRTTRTVTPTDAGLQLYQHARPIVDAVASAHAAVRSADGRPRGLLRVTLPPGAGSTFSDVLCRYMRDYPEVRLEVVSVARHVDMVAEGFDVGVRAGQLENSSLMSKKLLGMDMILVGGRDYLARRGTPRKLADLADHNALTGFARGEVPSRSWPLLAGGTTPVSPVLASNDLSLTLRAALDNHGLALLPRPLIAAPLAEGRLVPVLTGEVGVSTGLWVVYPEKRLMLPRVRLFIDRLTAWAMDHPFETLANS